MGLVISFLLSIAAPFCCVAEPVAAPAPSAPVVRSDAQAIYVAVLEHIMYHQRKEPSLLRVDSRLSLSGDTTESPVVRAAAAAVGVTTSHYREEPRQCAPNNRLQEQSCPFRDIDIFVVFGEVQFAAATSGASVKVSITQRTADRLQPGNFHMGGGIWGYLMRKEGDSWVVASRIPPTWFW